MKKPNLPISSTLGRAAGELAIIVAGVLIALAAQSWWEGRGEAEDRERALRALEADLAVIRGEMVRDSLNLTRISASLVTVIVEDGLSELPDSTLAVTLRAAFWDHGGRANYAFPAYQDLESSGRLELLPDSVRTVLTAYSNIRGSLENIFQDLQDVQEFRVDPWVIENFDTSRLLWLPDSGYDWPGRPAVAPARTRMARSLSVAKHQVIVAMLGQLRDAIEFTDYLRELIQRSGSSSP